MSRRTDYYHYLESSHWRALRKQAFERDGYKCQTCGTSKKLRGHHAKYRKRLEDCTVNDIQTLCEKCHTKHHRQERKRRREQRKPKITTSYLIELLCMYSAEI